MKTKFLEYEKNNQKTKRVFCLHFDENYGANFLFLDCFWQQEYFVPSTTTWTRGLGKEVELCRVGRHQGTVEKFKGKLGRTLDYIDPNLWLYSSRLSWKQSFITASRLVNLFTCFTQTEQTSHPLLCPKAVFMCFLVPLRWRQDTCLILLKTRINYS